MSDLVPVTQADRDAVQAFHRIMAQRIMSDIASERPKLGEDEGDAGTLVQAFARHRLAHSLARGGDELRGSLWKPADDETKRIGWAYDISDIEAVREEAEKVSGYDASLETYNEVMRIADRRLAALASTDMAGAGEGRKLIAFLNGEDHFDGYFFGDPHPDGAFWWRKHLPLLSAPPVEGLTSGEGREGCVGTMDPARATYFLERFKREEKLLGPHEQWALDYTIAMLAASPKATATASVREGSLEQEIPLFSAMPDEAVVGRARCDIQRGQAITAVMIGNVTDSGTAATIGGERA